MRDIEDMGYRAQAQGYPLMNNPYPTSDDKHWAWRKGWLEAFTDSH
jgi:hypothetical protein